MKILRIFLPAYRHLIKKLSKGHGLGKKKPIRILLRFSNRIFRSNFVEVHGHKMYLPPKGFDDYSMYGIYGEFETLNVEREIHAGEYVVDVGAAIGYYTLILARAVGPTGLVFAFEPKLERFEYLKKNIELNGYSNVILENKAILPNDLAPKFYRTKSSKEGIRLIDVISKDSKFTIPVEVNSVDLDSYLEKYIKKQKISFIKIDVDGPELLVLKSGKSLLENDDLKIFLEWDKKLLKNCNSEPAELIDLIHNNNFDIYYPDFKKNAYRLITKDELLKAESTNTINLLCKKLTYNRNKTL